MCAGHKAIKVKQTNAQVTKQIGNCPDVTSMRSINTEPGENVRNSIPCQEQERAASLRAVWPPPLIWLDCKTPHRLQRPLPLSLSLPPPFSLSLFLSLGRSPSGTLGNVLARGFA